MKFYDRKKELDILAKLEKKKPSFAVIYGKRRVGKTELIKQFSKNKKSIYIFVDNNKSERQLLNEYQILLKDKLNLEYSIHFENFKEFLSFLLKQDLIVIFDEFQRFLKINPSIINYFQEIIDMKLSKSMLIVSGSAYGMIKKIFIENEAPLFKRAELNLKLNDFSFKQIVKILNDLGIKNLEEQIKIYGLFGGSIFYYNLIEKFSCKSFNEIIDTLFLNEISPLKYEIQEWFIEQFGKLNKTYFDILYAISKGKNTKNEISNLTQIKETSLHPYLDDLIELLSVIEHSIPITEKKTSKKGRYKISHNFFKFWFLYIYENKNLFEIGNYNKIKEKIIANYPLYLGFVFEEICKEYLIDMNKNNKLPFDLDKLDKWWNKKGLEIDFIGTNVYEKKILFCECKFTNEKMGIDIFEKLKNKTKYINWAIQSRKEYYILFSKSGFKDDLLKLSKQNKNLLLIDLKNLKEWLEN